MDFQTGSDLETTPRFSTFRSVKTHGTHTAGNVDKILILHQMYCNVYGMRASKVMVCNGDRNTALMVVVVVVAVMMMAKLNDNRTVNNILVFGKPAVRSARFCILCVFFSLLPCIHYANKNH